MSASDERESVGTPPAPDGAHPGPGAPAGEAAGDPDGGDNPGLPAGPSYPGVGGTRTGAVPDGFSRLSRMTACGRGPNVFDRLASRLMDWGVHRGAGLAVRADGPAAGGVDVHLGLPGPVDSWKRALTCRVLYVVDEPGRRGFAYGTLPGGFEEGEARFLVETDPSRADAPVTFSVDGFNRPVSETAKGLGPLTRLGLEAVVRAYLGAARRAAGPTGSTRRMETGTQARQGTTLRGRP